MAKWPYSTARWQRLRKAHLGMYPLCQACPRPTPANHVDHIKPISEGGHPFPGHEGLRSYCAACHSAKTARGFEAGAVKTDRPRKGCDANGNPLDNAHPWATKSLRADRLGPLGDNHTQLVDRGPTDGR